MDTLIQTAILSLVFTAGLFGIAITPVVQDTGSVELGLIELSPNGEAGGFAIPASACSDPSSGCPGIPSITAAPPIIRIGDTAVVSWDPQSHSNCNLIGNLAAEGPVSSSGSEDVTPTAETIYRIECDGFEHEDSAVVRVLPRIQET